jgi:hypothetical protein
MDKLTGKKQRNREVYPIEKAGDIVATVNRSDEMVRLFGRHWIEPAATIRKTRDVVKT